MPLLKLLSVVLLFTAMDGVYAKQAAVDRQRMAIVRHKRVEAMKQESKEMDKENPHDYRIGKLDLNFGEDKKLNGSAKVAAVVTDESSKASLFKCALDEVENYPLQTCNFQMYVIVTDFYSPLGESVLTKSDEEPNDKPSERKELQVTIMIKDKNAEIDLVVKAFVKGKDGKTIEDKGVAKNIKNNIKNRYKREFPSSPIKFTN